MSLPVAVSPVRETIRRRGAARGVADRDAVAGDHVEHTRRKDVRGELGEPESRERRDLAGLEDPVFPVASAGPIFQTAIISG